MNTGEGTSNEMQFTGIGEMGPQPPWSQYPTTPPPPVIKSTNAFAVVSLVLSIVWAFWVGSILAVIFGIIALKQIKKEQSQGKVLAIVGTILGTVGILILLLTIIVGISYQPSTITYNGQPLAVSIYKFRDIPDGQGSSTHSAQLLIDVTNQGTASISLSSDIMEVTVYDQTNTPWKPTSWNCPGNGNSLSYLSPGETAEYCPSFDLPSSSIASKVEVSAVSGYGDGSLEFGLHDTYSGNS